MGVGDEEVESAPEVGERDPVADREVVQVRRRGHGPGLGHEVSPGTEVTVHLEANNRHHPGGDSNNGTS